MPRFHSLLPLAAGMAMYALPHGQLPSSDPLESRVALMAAAQSAEELAERTKDREEAARFRDRARVIRDRLEHGDLRVGDRIVIDVINPPSTELADTFTVRSGQVLQLPGISREIQLKGVLRFELTDFLTNELRRDYQNPVIRTSHMLGVFVTGQVVAPGTRTVTQDALLRDVVAAAGTITPMANIDKITIRRQGIVIYDPPTVRQALVDGKTIEDMQLIGGDEIDVGAKRVTNWLNILQIATGTLGLVLGIYSLAR